MLITYAVPFKRPFLLDDHWEVPLLEGTCRIVSEGEMATALEVCFSGQSVKLAPNMRTVEGGGEVKAHLQGNDQRVGFVRERLKGAIAFLKCIFDVDLSIGEIEVRYEAETPEEEPLIDVKSMGRRQQRSPLPLTFDFLTRALMAAEAEEPPFLVSTFIASAREALFARRFIDAFRYGFLLIDTLYGDGEFKKAGLGDALMRNAEFVQMVQAALSEPYVTTQGHKSATADLLASGASTDAIIKHLVERRGFYFHGNAKRKDAWKPHEQDEAEALALLTIGVVQNIGMKAAGSVFTPAFEKRHFDQAKAAGATIVLQVDFTYIEPGEQFRRKGRQDAQVPGTKVTPRLANDFAMQFLQQLRHDLPAAKFCEISCTLKNTGEKIFDIKFHVCDGEEN